MTVHNCVQTVINPWMEPLWGWRQIKGLASFPVLEECTVPYIWEHSCYEYHLVSGAAGDWGWLDSMGSSLCSAEGPALLCLVMRTNCACCDPRIFQLSFLADLDGERKLVLLHKMLICGFIYSRWFARARFWIWRWWMNGDGVFSR